MNTQLTYGKEFLSALIAARKEMNSPEKSGRNAHLKYDYAKYEDFVRAYEPALNKHGLATKEEKFKIDLNHELLVTRLVHLETNQYSTCESVINRHSNDQDWGKSISYARKYAYNTLVGAPSGDDSDADEFVSADQLRLLYAELNGHRERLEPVILNKANITNLRELLSADFDKVLDWVKKQKAAK